MSIKYFPPTFFQIHCIVRFCQFVIALADKVSCVLTIRNNLDEAQFMHNRGLPSSLSFYFYFT